MEIIRREILDSIYKWKDTHFIKVITGLRRCGKSTILRQYWEHLISQQKIKTNQIIYFDFNDIALSELSYKQIYDNVVKKSNPTMTNYLFLDEIQEIKNFEKCVISLFENKKIKFDIYLTGSNSHMFSSSFATLFTGRNKEIKVYPLSFNEIKRNLIKKASSHQSINEYIQYGGMGVVVPSYQNKVATMQILRDVFKDTVHKDIIVRNKIKNKVDFEKIVKFACTNIGNRISANKLENYLKSNKESKITKKTILKYFDWLCESLLFYKVTFYDTKGKNVLKTKSKYYAGDLGLLSSQTSFDASKNRGYRLENLVYLNLLSKGYEVYTSADRFEREIDFVCIKDNRISYYQVCSELNDKNYQREAGSLLAVKDNNHKMILCEEDNASITSDGIKRMNIFHWLLQWDNKSFSH